MQNVSPCISRRYLPPNKDRDVSYEILDEIKADFDAYNSKSYIAPYTSLLGPSGIGKSYAIQHIARKGIYVVYANLGDHDSMTYPRRSLLADRIALFQYRSPLTIYSECYVAASMVNVEICKDLKITPIAFFDMQAKVEFRGLQRDLQKSLDSLYWKSKTNVDEQGHPRIRSTDYPDDDFNYRSYIDPGLKEYKTNAHRAISKSFKEANSAEYVTSQPSASEDKLQAIICFDEARALLDTEHRPEPERDMKFRALRRALRHQTKIGEDTDDKRFFALFLDTTGRVSDFSPPTRDDLSLRYVDPETLDLFPPLYKIHGWDLFAVDDEEGWRQLYYSLEPSNSVRRLAYMRRLGRPLWGALCSMLSPDEVQNFAMKKIFRGHDEQTMTEIEALALLSYRINFDVRLPSIAKELTAGYMLCISSIDKTRSLLKTFQSSEPMLALCSQQKMSLESDSRLQIVRTLYSSIPKGTINTGDIGEIVAALILLFSFDRALPQGTFIPMKLSQFLESLLPDKVREKFADCMTQKEDLKRLWNDGYVFFNHFWRMERGQKPGVPTLRTAFYRGAALFPPPRYEGCDIIIPVLLPTEKKEMSYIVIQVKNRGDDVLGSSVKNEARNDLKACLKDLPDTAHIGLMLALRSKIGEDAEIVYPLARHDQAPELRSSSKTPSGKYRFDDKNRVIAAIVGTSFDLYPGLVHPNDDRNKPSSSSDMLHILKALLELGGTSEDNSAYSAAYMPPSG